MHRRDDQIDSIEVSEDVHTSETPTPMAAAPLKRRGKLAQWGVAVLSFGVLGAMIYWGMQLIERDPSDVPVIKAMEGPARVAPNADERGGVQAENLGLAVNEIQTGIGAGEAADRVVLAPEDQTLLPEEMIAPASVEVAVTEPEVAAVEVAEPEAPQEEVPVTEPAIVTPKALSDDEIAKMIAEATRNADDLPKVTRETEAVEVAAIALPSDTPKLRPSELAAKAKKAIAARPKPAPAKPKAADALAKRVASVPVGTKLVQLGAYDSEAIAEGEWKRLWTKHNDLLKSKSLLVQKTVSGGRTFYRLRAAGFESGDEAKNLCTALNARGDACLALTVRQ